MKKDTEKALTDLEWALAQGDDPRQPGEFTVAEFAKAAGIHADTAQKRVKRLVERGMLQSRKIREGGRQVTVYRRA